MSLLGAVRLRHDRLASVARSSRAPTDQTNRRGPARRPIGAHGARAGITQITARGGCYPTIAAALRRRFTNQKTVLECPELLAKLERELPS
jgi:hypothetical protein